MAAFYEEVFQALDAANVDFVVVGGLAVILHGVPRTTADLDVVLDGLLVETDEPDRRLDLLHRNVRSFGTVTNTVAPGTDLEGTLGRLARTGT